MIFVKIFIKIRICLILVIIQKIQFFDPVNKNVTGKRKYEFKKKKKKNSEFVGLKPKAFFD